MVKKQQEWVAPTYISTHMLEYDYDKTECDGTCGDDDYCRCGKIINGAIKDFNAASLLKEICKNSKSENIFFEYCVDRLLSIYRPTILAMELPVSQGYYGEEVCGGFELPSLRNDVETCYNLPSDKAIEFILEKEYGYLLYSLEGKEWNIERVLVDELYTGNSYQKMVKIDGRENNYSLPIGIYQKEGSKYRLIDGFHRFSTTKKDRQTSVEIIYCT